MKTLLKVIALAAALAALAGCSKKESTSTAANGGNSAAATNSTAEDKSAAEENSAGGESAAAESAAESAGENAGGNADFTPVEGTAYDTGMFSVTVPNGWLAVPVQDSFDNYDGDYDPTALNIVKGAKEDADMFDHAYIRMTLFDKDTMSSSKDFYDDVADLDPITVSGFECAAYSCTSFDSPYIMLEGTGAKNDISIALLLENDVNKMALNDDDVQTILNSIAVK